MAQNNFINGTFSAVRDNSNGKFGTVMMHGSASSADATFSWDGTKFTTKTALKDFLQKCLSFIDSRNDIPV